MTGDTPDFWIDHTGHEYVRLDNKPVVAHHRLIAYAHGEIDSLAAEAEIDHEIPIPWLNYDANLNALDPIDHGRITRARERRRRRRERSLREFVPSEEGRGSP